MCDETRVYLLVVRGALSRLEGLLIHVQAVDLEYRWSRQDCLVTT